MQLATQMLMNPSTWLGAASGSVAGMAMVAAKAAKTLLSSITSKIADWAARWAAKTGMNKLKDSALSALNAGWQWVKDHVGVQSKERQMLRASVTLSRSSEGKGTAWTKEFDLHYNTYITLEMRITVPGVVRIQALFAYVTNLNLSNLLNMLLSKLEGETKGTRFQQCLFCLSCGAMECEQGSKATDSHNFCADRRHEILVTNDTSKELVWKDECIPAASAELRCDSVKQPDVLLIDNVEECSLVMEKD